MLGHVFRADYEGDQWTFLKPTPDELRSASTPIDVHEMQPHRPLPEAIETQLTRGRTVIVELDSWYLPDTRGIGYRSHHIKTAIAPGRDRHSWANGLHYFHNGGLWSLGGEDFRGALCALDSADRRAAAALHGAGAFRSRPARCAGELSATRRAAAVARGHLRRRPGREPVHRRFGRQLTTEPSLACSACDMQEIHDYLFHHHPNVWVGVRARRGPTCGWLFEGEAEFEAVALDQIVAGCKSLAFRLARRRPFDTDALIGNLERQWELALDGSDPLVSPDPAPGDVASA